jgi:hypothetical protein
MFNFSHPFFRPLWLRVLVVCVALGWALVEILTGSPGWAIIFGALGAVAFWGLIVAYDPSAPRGDRK